MKLIKTIGISIFLYTLLGISSVHATTLYPAVNELSLSQGERKLSSVIIENTQDKDIEILLSTNDYNYKDDEIIKDSKNIFLKVDTDTFVVKANSKKEIPYEIYPVENLEKGTYFNILVLSEVTEKDSVYINKAVSQLVVLHIVDRDDQVKGITTSDFTAKIDVVQKGIPFISLLKIKYTIQNNSNYVLAPIGRIEVFNSKGNYKPKYLFINRNSKKLYPKDSLQEELSVKQWHISDILYKRVAIGNFSSGLDSTSINTETTINSYTVELIILLSISITTVLLIKSLKEDKKKN